KPILKTGEQENLWNAVSQIKYLFKHSLLRDAAYNMQMKKQLKKLHKIAAITMEKVFINNKNFYSDIAFHYEQAEMKNKAKKYLLLAGDFAKENYKNKDAVSLYERLLKYEKGNRESVSIKMRIGEIYEIIGKWKESIEMYRSIKRIGNGLKDELIIADAENRHGYISLRLGNNEYAIKLFKRALEKYKKINGKVGISGTYNNYGIAYGNLGNFEKALYYYNKNLLFIEKNEKIKKKLLFDKALTYNNMGLIYQYKGNYRKALMFFNKSKKISNKMGLKRIPALTNIANIQFLKGNLDNAEALYKKLLIKNNELGERYVIRILQNNLGSICTLRGNYQEALKYFEMSYDLAVSIGDKGGIRTVLSNLGDVYFETGNLSKSLNYLNKALILAKELKGDQKLFTIYFDLVSIYKITGKYSIAITYLDKVIKKAKVLNAYDRLIKALLCKAGIFYEQKNKNMHKIIKKIEKYSSTNFYKSHSFDIEFVKIKSGILLNNDSAISCLENMLNKYKNDENQAEIFFELYRLTNKKAYKIKALKLYKKLHSAKKSYRYKMKIDVLK
ncbi:tetratricopeptide repeat protein, partial [candidate division WOR-3 bacterium]|nr:tetratricopeptide repeat protein [candidate division WOR-3 bacterium]